MFGKKGAVPDPKKFIGLLGKDGSWPSKAFRIIAKMDEEQRWELLQQTLSELGPAQAGALVRMCFDAQPEKLCAKAEYPKDKYLAAEALGYLDKPEISKLLIGLMAHQDVHLQLAAAGALKNHDPERLIPLLLKAMLHEEVPASRAVEVLLATGAQIQPRILEVYPYALPAVKARFLELLSQTEGADILAEVRAALAAQHTELNDRALDVAARLDYRELWEEVAAYLERTKDWKSKVKALGVLERLAVRESIPVAEKYLYDEDAWVQEAAAKCIESIEGG